MCHGLIDSHPQPLRAPSTARNGWFSIFFQFFPVLFPIKIKVRVSFFEFFFQIAAVFYVT